MLPPGQFFELRHKLCLLSLVSYRTLAHLYTSRREVVSGAWTSRARDSQSGAIYTLRAGQDGEHGNGLPTGEHGNGLPTVPVAVASQAALNCCRCCINDAILP